MGRRPRPKTGDRGSHRRALPRSDRRYRRGGRLDGVPGKYIAEVFKTCKTKSRYQVGWQPWPPFKPVYVYIWWKRTNVSNIVWCLEEEITPVYHDKDSVFDGIGRPWDVKVKANRPTNWSIADIRRTWLKNLN